MLKYTEKLNEQAKLEKMNDKVKLEESNARFDKWKESSKNLVKLINSSMSSRSKFEKPLYDRFVKAVGMHVVPPPIIGTFMPPSNNRYEANATAEKHLSQADLAASRNRVPVGKIDSAAGVSYGPTETSTPVVKHVHTDAPLLPPGHCYP
ncbi:hypothetical protein Tco_0181163 [Tanacetum coccineum]